MIANREKPLERALNRYMDQCDAHTERAADVITDVASSVEIVLDDYLKQINGQARSVRQCQQHSAAISAGLLLCGLRRAAEQLGGDVTQVDERAATLWQMLATQLEFWRELQTPTRED